MSSLKKSYGNMYDWVTYTWSPILGCSHQCLYCYVRKNHELPEIPILNKKDFPDLGTDKVIFVGHLCDMFSEATESEYISKVLRHCEKFPLNTYVLQTKNLKRLFDFAPLFPPKVIIGTTIESNRADMIKAISNAPPPQERIETFKQIKNPDKFITIEPILDFDVKEFSEMLIGSGASFINIGADSKGHDLLEPSTEKVRTLINALMANKITIRKKINLERLGIDVKEFIKND